MAETPATNARNAHVHLLLPTDLHRWLIQEYAKAQYQAQSLTSFSAFVAGILAAHRQRTQAAEAERQAQRRQAEAQRAPQAPPATTPAPVPR